MFRVRCQHPGGSRVVMEQHVQFGWVARRLGLRPALWSTMDGSIQGLPAKLRVHKGLELSLGSLPKGLTLRPRGGLFPNAGSDFGTGDPDFDERFCLGGDERLARALLDGDARRRAVLLSGRMILRLKGGVLRGRLIRDGVVARIRPDAVIAFQALVTLAMALRPGGRPLDQRLLDNAIDDPSAGARQCALRVLLATGEPRVVELAARAALVGFRSRLRAVEATGDDAGLREALAELALIPAAPPTLRAAAMRRLALGSVGRDGGVEVATGGLWDPAPEVRRAAITVALSAGLAGVREVEDALLHAAGDDVRDVRVAALRAIAALGTTRSVPGLTALGRSRSLSASERALARRAASRLRPTGAAEAVGALSLAVLEGGDLSLTNDGSISLHSEEV